eukprot:PhM_4_TR8384/c2_g1_i3/m.11976
MFTRQRHVTFSCVAIGTMAVLIFMSVAPSRLDASWMGTEHKKDLNVVSNVGHIRPSSLRQPKTDNDHAVGQRSLIPSTAVEDAYPATAYHRSQNSRHVHPTTCSNVRAHRDYRGVVHVVGSTPSLYETYRWNRIVLEPRHCVLNNSEVQYVACCHGGDYLRLEVFPPSSNQHTLFVDSTDHGDGRYSYDFFPLQAGPHKLVVSSAQTIFTGVSLFGQPWRTKPSRTELASIQVVQGPRGALDLGNVATRNALRALPMCHFSSLSDIGAWLSYGPTLNHYFVPSHKCVHTNTRYLTGTYLRKCVDGKHFLFNGDSTLVEQVTAIQSKLYDNFIWHRRVFEPNFRQFDVIHTNENDRPTYNGDVPVDRNFTFRLSVFWNGAPNVDGNFRGLTTYDEQPYKDMLYNHTRPRECNLMKPRHRGNRRECRSRNYCVVKPMMFVSLLANESRSPQTCEWDNGKPKSTYPDVVVLTSGMHDYTDG